MRVSSRFALLVLAVLLVSGGLVAASPILAGGVAPEQPVFGLARVRPPAPAVRVRAARDERGGFFGRMIGYRSAQAEELPPQPAATARDLLFHHAALGVAELDAPAPEGIGPAVVARVAVLPVDRPGPELPGRPSPVPIPLMIVLVMGPSLLLVVQALGGGPKGAALPARRRS